MLLSSVSYVYECVTRMNFVTFFRIRNYLSLVSFKYFPLRVIGKTLEGNCTSSDADFKSG